MKYPELMELTSKLQEYTHFCNDGTSETVEMMCNLVNKIDYVSEEFYDALGVELQRLLTAYETETRMIEYTEMREHTVKELVWK